ncbi:hypothetical protein [Streptomyces sp. NPDC059862]|uniref:hypothetical protein n=1 Tax=unclassified Streptomyces TaxID=2593676 RepID=UPI0036379F26
MRPWAGLLVGLLVVEPVLRGLNVDHYQLMNTLLVRRMDRLMPALVVLAALVDVALTVTVDRMAALVLYGLAAACVGGIAVVSRLRARPLYEWVEKIDVADPLPERGHVRLRWRTVHQARVGRGTVAVSLGTVAAAVSV